MAVHIDATNDLGTIWDPDSTRLADVLVSEGRLEVVLRDTDHEWVRHALETLQGCEHPTLVIACPE